MIVQPKQCGAMKLRQLSRVILLDRMTFVCIPFSCRMVMASLQHIQGILFPNNVRIEEKKQRDGRKIPHAVLLTRTSAAIASRSLKNVRDQLDKAGIDVFRTSIVERAAYRDLFEFGGLLSDLDPNQSSNLDKAVQNAREFAGEVLTKLKAAATVAKVA